MGGLAQLGEHLLCKQGVNGSIPLASTITYRVKKLRAVKCKLMKSIWVWSFRD